MTNELQKSRRNFLSKTALAMAAGVSGLGATAAAASLPVRVREYWAKRGDISLYLFRKTTGSVASQNSPLPVLLLAHGSSVSSRPTFDLSVPGHEDYSFMDKFAGYGFDVWTMDFEGYGRSSKSAGNSNIADGVEDLKAAAAVIQNKTGQQSFHLYGESGGALRAGAFAMEEPHRVRRLVLSAFTWTGIGSDTLAKRSEDGEYYRTHNTRPRDRNMIRSIFTRDKPGTSDPAVAEAMADAELPLGTTVPTGTYVDMTTKLPLVDPARLTMPVQIIRGEFDGIATEDDLLAFFRKLATSDREFIILPGAAHSVALGTNRAQFWHVMRTFLEMPPRLDTAQISDQQNTEHTTA